MSTNLELVHTIDDIELIPIVFPTNPPTERHIVVARGTARSSASNARLYVSREPTIPGLLLLEMVADHGSAAVITPVSATRTFNLGGIMTVTVKGRENSISKSVPKADRPASGPKVSTAGNDFDNRRWRATHFLLNKSAPEPVIPGTQLTAFFSDSVSGSVTGSGGCNAYGASFVWQPIGNINIQDLTHTLLFCEQPGLMEQERRFFDYLLGATQIECRDNILEVRSGPQGVGTGIRFDLAKPQP